jgi:hypothetical protein
VEYLEWDLPKALSQGRAELLDYSDSKRFYSESDVVEYNKILIAEGSRQNLTWSSIKGIVSRNMTSFLVLKP